MKRRKNRDDQAVPDVETASDAARGSGQGASPDVAGAGGDSVAGEGGDADRGAFEGEPDAISAEIHEELRELDELRDRHLRVVAEFENYRKRTRRELSETRHMGQGDIASVLLEVLDDLSRVATIPVGQTTVEALHEGVELVNRKLLKKLEDAGLRSVEAGDGVVFDPAVHEAILTVRVDDPALDDRISRVFSPGFLFGDRLLRPAQVEVQQYPDDVPGATGADPANGADTEA